MLNLSQQEYEAYRSRYMFTTTRKYPDCLPMNYEHWKQAQISSYEVEKLHAEGWANAG